MQLPQLIEQLTALAHKVTDDYLENKEQETVPELHDTYKEVTLDTLIQEAIDEGVLSALMAHRTIRGNQSKAALMYGRNRGTLRTRLKRVGLLNPPTSEQRRISTKKATKLKATLETA